MCFPRIRDAPLGQVPGLENHVPNPDNETDNDQGENSQDSPHATLIFREKLVPRPVIWSSRFHGAGNMRFRKQLKAMKLAIMRQRFAPPGRSEVGIYRTSDWDLDVGLLTRARFQRL